MPSFDVVSRVDMHRWTTRSTSQEELRPFLLYTEIELDRKEAKVNLLPKTT